MTNGNENRGVWISESDPICWHTVTESCNTANKAKRYAMAEGLEDSEYMDLRVRKVYGRTGVGLGPEFDEYDWQLQLCKKDDDGAFPVWEIRDAAFEKLY